MEGKGRHLQNSYSLGHMTRFWALDASKMLGKTP